ncbi:hypothetical protein [Trinickia mobilis]|uniref:hypothetical protein n=1 Tax=Trinickia mobilis TaxID=2816356 RepID=UPI001A8F745F|nr:hypothetical protein [Trinickia mobilis]
MLHALKLAGGWLLCAQAAGGVLFNGQFEVGAGDRCQGTLIVTNKAVEWQTPFGHCRSGYELLSKTDDGKDRHVAYRLTKTGKWCRYSMLMLEYLHDYPDYWTASWYRSPERYRQGDEALVCPIVRFDR